ncbi:hypothetical protein [Brevundimonas sp. Root1279]|uniref:hypothetical protein n=1 Tax=Brevundimonas sp. Root1279 TaxID=1736443 RepID=UPI0006F54333|nr:hypothetical protein [Brevundimonas sp. Root1279]KQW84059.1 hypothetical protein ASC65_05430 [Brevundimonas sp. Root1279]
MRIHQILCGAAAASLLAFSVAAQDGQATVQDGQYGQALSQILTEARAGTCSDLMSAGVQLACQRRIESIAATLERFGPVQSITFVKAEERSGRIVETWVVGFAEGRTMTWVIGGLHDGQFSTAFSEDA